MYILNTVWIGLQWLIHTRYTTENSFTCMLQFAENDIKWPVLVLAYVILYSWANWSKIIKDLYIRLIILFATSFCMIHVHCPKTSQLWLAISYNLDIHEPILMILGRHVTATASNHDAVLKLVSGEPEVGGPSQWLRLQRRWRVVHFILFYDQLALMWRG